MKIVIDANLLLLLVVGLAGQVLIKKHKRLQAYEVRHFTYLRTILADYDGIVVTPHSLTELWHLIGEQDARKTDADKIKIQQTASVLMRESIEVFEPSKNLAANPSISRLGLSDVAQIHAAQRGHTLISVDGPLCYAARLQSVTAINFWQATEGL
jgi:hypothetical protein